MRQRRRNSQMTDVWGKMISDVWLTFCSPINRDKWAQTSEHSQSFSPSWAASWNDLIISLIVAIKKTSRSCQYFGDSFGMNDPKIKKHSSAHMIVNLCVKKNHLRPPTTVHLQCASFGGRGGVSVMQGIATPTANHTDKHSPDNFSLLWKICKVSLRVI